MRSVLLVTICFSCLWGLEITGMSGRVDYQTPGRLDWQSAQDEKVAGNNEVFRVQERSSLQLRDSLGMSLVLHGPGQIRINRILDPNSGPSTYILGELRGLYHLNWKGEGLAPHRMICNNVTLHSFRGSGRFFCEEDSLTLIVWMEQGGQITAQRGEAYSVRVESGRVWRMRTIDGKTEDQFVDSAWAGEYLRTRFGEAAPQEHKKGRIRLIWDNTASIPQGFKWNGTPFFGENLKNQKGVVFTDDTLAWTVKSKIEQFQIVPEERAWQLHLRVRFQIENREMPLQNKEIIFERHEAVPDSTPNRIGLLKLLPLDHRNLRIEGSRLGEVARELGAFFENEVVDPYRREGF